ncbi:MAG: carboxypeptidase regulatory-like domain-containing protein, partial [Planctomycetota bacterium]|nr:carboxypeptidase regulatory-like domain-containing protein [Planctomycetota bacterium]
MSKDSGPTAIPKMRFGNLLPSMAERVEVLRTGPHESGFAIWTKPFSSSTDEGNLDVALIDVTGKRHNRFTSGSDGNEAYHAFRIKPEEIDKFVVRLRPFQYLATFENVSLKPGKKSDVKVSISTLPAEKTLGTNVQKPSDEKPVVEAEATDATQVSHFAGTVKDETGQPLAGARIYVARQNSKRADPAPVRTTTDADGHFEFDAPEMTYAQVDGTPALYDGWLIATKEDYGTDFFQTRGSTYNGSLWSTISVNHGEIELQLTKDDVPVRGRLFDPEGQPLAGAQVTMKSIGVPRKFSLDAHLEREAAATQEGRIFTGAKIYERSMLEPQLLPGLTTEIQTNADGWFEFNGIGRERLVTLSVVHPLIQDANLEVMTRVGPDVGTIRDLEGKPTQTIQGSGFTKQMPVGLTVRGIVRDRTTKKPLAGMWVTTKGHPVRYAAYNPNPAVTDENGRFTITGMNPIYATLAKEKRDIAAYPQPGMPYVMRGTHFETDGETIIEC